MPSGSAPANMTAGVRSPACAQPAGLVEGAGHERRKPFAVERPRHGRGAVPVGIALERSNDGLAGRTPAANGGEIGQQPVQIVNGPAGMRGFRHPIALPGTRPRPGACSCGFFAISNRRGGPWNRLRFTGTLPRLSPMPGSGAGQQARQYGVGSSNHC